MNHSAVPADASASGWAALRTTRRTPSAPMPRRRSQSAATNVGVNGSVPSGSGRMTKSLPVPCPLAKRMVSILPHDLQCRCGDVGSATIEPHDPVIPAEPGPLPAHEPPGGAYRLRLGGRLIRQIGKVVQYLLIAECGPGG